jgi:hypothetical protein
MAAKAHKVHGDRVRAWVIANVDPTQKPLGMIKAAGLARYNEEHPDDTYTPRPKA